VFPTALDVAAQSRNDMISKVSDTGIRTTGVDISMDGMRAGRARSFTRAIVAPEASYLMSNEPHRVSGIDSR
jgi:hypothetical protein